MVLKPPSVADATCPVVAVLLLLGGCAARVADPLASRPFVDNPTRAADPNRPCDIPVHEEVQLTAEDRCVLELYKKRCDENDACIVDCIANGKGRVRFADGNVGVVGGGCWHVCFAYTGIKWTPPDGFEECSHSKGEAK